MQGHGANRGSNEGLADHSTPDLDGAWPCSLCLAVGIGRIRPTAGRDVEGLRASEGPAVFAGPKRAKERV